MLCRRLSVLAQIGTRSVSRIFQRRNERWGSEVFKQLPRFLSSEVTNSRLWSDSGGTDAVSNPFDDLGAWHDAEAKSFLHKVSVDVVGKSTSLGHREVNEDSHKLLELEDDLFYFAVFDGHGGSFAVDFVSENLHDCIKHFYAEDKNLESVLSKAFEKCNSDLENYCKWISTGGHKDNNIFRSGTTATVALLRDGTDLAVASVGDSGALICRHGVAVPLSNPHEPFREDEQDRITSLDGWIDWDFAPRVNGRLAMTRSIGDFDLKPYGVLATPETERLKIDYKADEFIVLHTDGLSHVMSDQEMTELVLICPDADHAANTLTSWALQYGSEDNVTAVVIPLKSWSKSRSQQISKEHSLLKNMRIKCI